MAEKHKEVLVVFRDRRRPIFFECSSDPQVEYQHILDAVKETLLMMCCRLEKARLRTQRGIIYKPTTKCGV